MSNQECKVTHTINGEPIEIEYHAGEWIEIDMEVKENE